MFALRLSKATKEYIVIGLNMAFFLELVMVVLRVMLRSCACEPAFNDCKPTYTRLHKTWKHVNSPVMSTKSRPAFRFG